MLNLKKRIERTEAVKSNLEQQLARISKRELKVVVPGTIRDVMLQRISKRELKGYSSG